MERGKLGLHGHLPLLIELRDFVLREAEGRCIDLLSYLGFTGESLGFGFSADAIKQRLANNPALLIIDGLDEIFDSRRRSLMIEEIVGLAGRFPHLRFLLTARIAGFNEHALRSADFTVATLVELSPEQVETFAHHWFRLVFPGDPAAAERARDDLVQTVQRRPQLRVLAGNPMLLTIMATIARHKPLARSRAALYAQALELLCYNWDYRRGLNLPPDSPLKDLTPDDTSLMLRRVAWRMQEAPDGLRANAVTEAELLRVLEQFFREDWRFDVPKAARAAREMEQRLQDRNWILTLRGPGLFGFVHRTFLEYLCSMEVVERFRTQALDADILISKFVMPHVQDDVWREVIRLIAGSVPPHVAENMVIAITPDQTELGRNIGQLGLAWLVLAEVEPRLIPSLTSACARLTQGLYHWAEAPEPEFDTDKDEWESHVAAMITEAVGIIGSVQWPAPYPPAIDWPKVMDHPPSGFAWDYVTQIFSAVAAVGKLVWNAYEPTYDWLRSIAISDKEMWKKYAAIGALGSRFAEDSRTDSVLSEIGNSNVKDGNSNLEEVVRGKAFSTLVEYFWSEPTISQMLLEHAVDDPSATVRGAILQAFAQRPRNSLEVGELVRSRAVEDPDDAVRAAAVYALARHRLDDPRTGDLLRARAVDDPGAYARGAALDALAQHFRDEPRTADLLRARAVDDPGAYARRAALAALAQHFRDEPRTADLLRARAVDDPDAYARRAALDALAQHFRDDPRTADLLRARAVDDPHEYARLAALVALAQHFRDQPRTAGLLRARAVDDPDEDVRRAALLALAKLLGIEDATVLCSRDLDGLNPGLDARKPVTQTIVARAVKKLGKSEQTIRALYEQIARVAPLRLAWQAPRRKRAR